AILQQEIFEFSQKLHSAEVECCSLHLQLAEFKLTFSEMQKDVDKAHKLQEQLNALQHVSIFDLETILLKTNIQEELENALQQEREERLLLQEREQLLQEVINRLELHTRADTERGQDSNVSLMLRFPSDAMEYMRRDQVLNRQKRLLKDMEQDRQRLRE
ncbi:CC171 protein, partial [Spelaeornis formosus]|nr:CC171 protein [Elachura formosa]